jgi:hypothetical protein
LSFSRVAAAPGAAKSATARSSKESRIISDDPHPRALGNALALSLSRERDLGGADHSTCTKASLLSIVTGKVLTGLLAGKESAKPLRISSTPASD